MRRCQSIPARGPLASGPKSEPVTVTTSAALAKGELRLARLMPLTTSPPARWPPAQSSRRDTCRSCKRHDLRPKRATRRTPAAKRGCPAARPYCKRSMSDCGARDEHPRRWSFRCKADRPTQPPIHVAGRVPRRQDNQVGRNLPCAGQHRADLSLVFAHTDERAVKLIAHAQTFARRARRASSNLGRRLDSNVRPRVDLDVGGCSQGHQVGQHISDGMRSLLRV